MLPSRQNPPSPKVLLLTGTGSSASLPGLCLALSYCSALLGAPDLSGGCWCPGGWGWCSVGHCPAAVLCVPPPFISQLSTSSQGDTFQWTCGAVPTPLRHTKCVRSGFATHLLPPSVFCHSLKGQPEQDRELGLVSFMQDPKALCSYGAFMFPGDKNYLFFSTRVPVGKHHLNGRQKHARSSGTYPRLSRGFLLLVLNNIHLICILSPSWCEAPCCSAQGAAAAGALQEPVCVPEPGAQVSACSFQAWNMEAQVTESCLATP